MESTAIHAAKQILFLVGIILFSGTLSGFLAQKSKLPDVVLFLLVGICLGPELAGAIRVQADSTVNQLILIFGSSYILFDGGAGLRLKVLKEVWITILAISTLGVLITAALTGLAASWLLGLPLIGALLLGSTIASTDPATLVPVFKQVLNMAPKLVSSPPCQELVREGDEIDLSVYPIQTCWPDDAAPLITWPLVITKGPNKDRQNLGIYRQQVIGKNKVIMRWLAHRGGALRQGVEGAYWQIELGPYDLVGAILSAPQAKPGSWLSNRSWNPPASAFWGATPGSITTSGLFNADQIAV